MSIINSMLKMLNTKDKNFIFNENFITERKLQEKRCLVISGYLKNELECCPCCGCLNENTIIKKGTRKFLIKIDKHAELMTYLNLSKQRYRCKNCNKKFYEKTDEVNYRCHISNQVELVILNCVKEMIIKSLIARLYNVSDNTVQRVFDGVFYNDTVYKNFLPKAICINEFTFKKKTHDFNICNAKNGKTIDLVLDRITNNLDKYFVHYTEKAS